MIPVDPSAGFILILIYPLAFFLFIYLVYFVLKFIFSASFRKTTLTKPTASAVVFILGVGLFALYFYANNKLQESNRVREEKYRKERASRNITLKKATAVKGEIFPAGTYIDNYYIRIMEKEYDFDFATFPSSYDYHGYGISYIEDLWRDSKQATVKFAEPTQLMQFTCQANTKVDLEITDTHIKFSKCILAEPVTLRGIYWEKGTEVNVSNNVYWRGKESGKEYYTYIMYRINGIGKVTKKGVTYHQKLSYRLSDNYSDYGHEQISDAHDNIIYEYQLAPYKSKKDSNGKYYCQLQTDYMNSRYKFTHITTGKTYTGITDGKGFTKKILTDGEQSFYFEVYDD